jgi:subtilisin family serine protease
MAKAMGHDHYIEYEIDSIYDRQAFSQVYPPFLTRRTSDGRSFRDFQNICGAGTWADESSIIIGVGDTGIDATHLKNGEFGPKAKYRNFTSDSTGTDINGHGSHVAGHILAADNGAQIMGLAPKATLVAAKVLGGRQGSGLTSWIMDGVQWMADEGAAIINLSLGGGGYYQPADELYAKLDAQGIIVNAATGNAGKGGERGGYPSLYNSTASIAAVDYNLKTAGFSSESKKITKVGYGVGIDSLWINGKRASISGTSMATPDQSGMDANFLGYFDRLGMGRLNRTELNEKLKVGSIDLGIDGPDTYFGQLGFIDIWKVIDHYGLPEDKKPVEPVKPEPKPPICDPDQTCGDLVFCIPGTDFCLIKRED